MLGLRFAPPTFLVLALLAACAPVTPLGPRTVTLIADGESHTFTTQAATVRDLLAEAGVTLDVDDFVEPAEITLLQEGMVVRVTRVEERSETEERVIPFERQTVRDTSVPVGETRLLQAGENGLERITYRILLHNGVEVERSVAGRVVLEQPRAEVVLVGIQEELTATPISGTVAYLANHNAWVMQGSSGNRRRLTHEGDLDGRVFALSPDGSRLLFTRVPTGASAPLNTLWLVDTRAADAEPVRLRAEEVLWAGWAPDGERIAYSTGEVAESSPGWRARNDLWVATPRDDGQLSGIRLVLAPSAGGSYGWWGTSYAWAPDGSTLAYARADGVGIVRVSTGAETPLAQFPVYRTYASWVWVPSLSWSPDGRFIVTTLHGPSPTGEPPEDSPVFDVWALSADGRIRAELAHEAGMWAVPTWSPRRPDEAAGRVGFVAFGRARTPYASHTSRYDLYVMDRDGSDHRRLFPSEGEPGLEYPEVAWGPDGEQLIVAYQGNLYLIRITDGEVRQLTSEGGASAPRWGW